MYRKCYMVFGNFHPVFLKKFINPVMFMNTTNLLSPIFVWFAFILTRLFSSLTFIPELQICYIHFVT
jgi:hypothetical protein